MQHPKLPNLRVKRKHDHLPDLPHRVQSQRRQLSPMPVPVSELQLQPGPEQLRKMLNPILLDQRSSQRHLYRQPDPLLHGVQLHEHLPVSNLHVRLHLQLLLQRL